MKCSPESFCHEFKMSFGVRQKENGDKMRKIVSNFEYFLLFEFNQNSGRCFFLQKREKKMYIQMFEIIRYGLNYRRQYISWENAT